MGVWSLELVSLIQLIQLVQEDRSVKFPVVSVAEALHGLVDRVLVLVVKKICDFTCPVHGLDGNLNSLGLISGDNVVHGSHVASRFDLDGVAGLNLHGRHVVGCWADLIGADRPNGVDGPSVLRELENFLPGFGNLESAVSLDRMGVGHEQCS